MHKEEMQDDAPDNGRHVIRVPKPETEIPKPKSEVDEPDPASLQRWLDLNG